MDYYKICGQSFKFITSNCKNRSAVFFIPKTVICVFLIFHLELHSVAGLLTLQQSLLSYFLGLKLLRCLFNTCNLLVGLACMEVEDLPSFWIILESSQIICNM